MDVGNYADLFTVYFNMLILLYIPTSLMIMNVFLICCKLGLQDTGTV